MDHQLTNMDPQMLNVLVDPQEFCMDPLGLCAPQLKITDLALLYIIKTELFRII